MRNRSLLCYENHTKHAHMQMQRLFKLLQVVPQGFKRLTTSIIRKDVDVWRQQQQLGVVKTNKNQGNAHCYYSCQKSCSYWSINDWGVSIIIYSVNACRRYFKCCAVLINTNQIVLIIMKTLLIMNSWKVIVPVCDTRVSGPTGLKKLCARHKYKHFHWCAVHVVSIISLIFQLMHLLYTL
jgi:hypothetical protein